MPINYPSLALAALGGTGSVFGFGFLVLWLLPGIFEESQQVSGRIPSQRRNDGEGHTYCIRRELHIDLGCGYYLFHDPSRWVGH